MCLIVAFNVTIGKKLMQNSFESHKNTISAGHVHQEVMQKRKKGYFCRRSIRKIKKKRRIYAAQLTLIRPHFSDKNKWSVWFIKACSLLSFISFQEKPWSCFIGDETFKTTRLVQFAQHVYYPPVTGSSILWVWLEHGSTERQSNKERSREVAMGSLLFLWEEWHLEQRGQLCEQLCLGQADWQRPNTPSPPNQPPT